MVKINRMTEKKTGGIFLVVHVIYGSLVYTDSKKTVSCLLLPDGRLRAFHEIFKR